MNRLARSLLSAVTALAIPAPAFAEPHVIAQLGNAPLIGQISSTPQLQADVTKQSELFRTAGSKLGLTPQEYSQVAARIQSRQLSYVTLPRHLDAMSWSSGGRVYVLKDVIIPAGTNGWEIDLPEASQQIAVFIPARCGNLSLVRRPLRRIARVAPAKSAPPSKPRVLAASTAPPAPPAAAPAPPAPAENGSPAVYVAPAAQPAAASPLATTAAPVTHSTKLWPLLLLPLIGFAVSHHGGGSTPTYLSPPLTVPGAPPPVPGCPPPVPH